jgi:hypothetical protein
MIDRDFCPSTETGRLIFELNSGKQIEQTAVTSSSTFISQNLSFFASCTVVTRPLRMPSDSSITRILTSITEEGIDKQISPPLPCARNENRGTETLSSPVTLSRVSSKPTLKRSMRSPSASSFLYHMKKLPMNDVIPLGGDADPQLVKEFLEIAEKRAVAFKANVHRSRAFQVSWYLAVTCIIYFGFIGLPLWDGICYSV